MQFAILNGPRLVNIEIALMSYCLNTGSSHSLTNCNSVADQASTILFPIFVSEHSRPMQAHIKVFAAKQNSPRSFNQTLLQIKTP